MPSTSPTSKRLADLRALVHEPPSERAWIALLRAFADWPPDDDRAVALDYAAQHLDRWPDALRRVRTLPDPDALPVCWPLIRTVAPWANKRFVTDAKLRALVHHPCVRQLTQLRLWSCKLGLDSVRAIATSPHLTRLDTLDVGGLLHDAYDAQRALDAITRSPHAARLRALHTNTNRITSDTLRSDFHAHRLSALTHLDLSNNPLTPDGLRVLADLPATGLDRLEHLELRRALRPAEPPAEDTRPGRIGRALRSLFQRRRPTPPPAAPHTPLSPLLHDATWHRLRHLDLSDNLLNAAHLSTLRDLPERPALRWLSLSGNALDADAIGHLSAWDGLAQLDLLNLAFNPVRDAAIDRIANNPAWGAIDTLVLRGWALTPKGAERLLTVPHLRTHTRVGVLESLPTDHLHALARRRGIPRPASRHPHITARMVAKTYGA